MSNPEDADDSTAGINDVHRAFIQALFARQVLTHDELKHLLSALHTARTPSRPTLPNDITQLDIDDALQRANDSLSAYDFELRSAQPQSTSSSNPTNGDGDARVYALVNTTSDVPTQLATHLRPDEIAYVRRLLDALFDTRNTRAAEVCAVTSVEALDLRRVSGGEDGGGGGDTTQLTQGGGANAGLTFSAVGRVLDDLVAGKWLVLSPKGYYSLAPRGLMELKGWLVETYNDPAYEDEEDDGDEDDDEGTSGRYIKIKFCAACREIVTVGQRCPNIRCLCRMHHACVAVKFRAQGGADKCPLCETTWRDPGMVGEKAARREGRQQPAQSSRNGRRSTRHDEDEDDEAMET